MSEIRVANVSLATGEPFRALQDLDFISYQENSPQENARKLFEREIDVALLPINAFAASGSYVGLDFGVAAEKNHSQLHIFCHRPIETLDTIYVFDGSSAAIFLLRLLLRYRFRCEPRIVPKRHLTLKAGLLANEGILVQPSHLHGTIRRFRYEIDLIREWHELTNLPFVFLLWATHSESLTWAQHRLFHDQCHKVVRAYLGSTEDGVGDVSYHFDFRAKAGIERIFHDAYRENMLPESRYVPGTYTLLDRLPKKKSDNKTVDAVLREAMDGKRIAMQDAMTLVKNAKLSDLSMVAEFGARIPKTDQKLRLYSVLQEVHGLTHTYDRLDKAFRAGVTDIRFITNQSRLQSLSAYEKLFHEFKVEYPEINLQAFSPRSMLLLAEKESLPLQEVASRLVASGVSEISSAGCGMLVDSVHKRNSGEPFSVDDYIRAIKWTHRYGAYSTARLTISSLESWEERIVHLQKIRALQDTNPGFRTFCLRTTVHGKVSLEERLRTYLVSRIFLDNIMLSKEIVSSVTDLGSLFRLNFGVDEVCYYDFGDYPYKTKRRFERYFREAFAHELAVSKEGETKQLNQVH